MQNYAPIILFVYNRPEHTAKTLTKLSENPLTQQSTLYIFSDGAKHSKDEDKVTEVRTVISQPLPFKEINIIHRPQNLGLASNVIDGVTQVIDRHGKAIILEDDVLLAPYALDYFNEALIRYQNIEKVMHVGAYMYNIDRNGLEETFFTRLSMSQGWATWKRAWDFLEKDIDVIISRFDKKKIKNFTFDGTMNFWKQIQAQKMGKINSWAVRWYASIFFREGLAIQTKYSLLDNIGHDGSGIHSSISNMFDTEIQETKVLYFPNLIEENPLAYRALKEYFKRRKGTLFDRGCRFLINQWHKLFQK